MRKVISSGVLEKLIEIDTLHTINHIAALAVTQEINRKFSTVFEGFEVSALGVELDVGKSVCVQNCPRPQTVRDVRTFLGLAAITGAM